MSLEYIKQPTTETFSETSQNPFTVSDPVTGNELFTLPPALSIGLVVAGGIAIVLNTIKALNKK